METMQAAPVRIPFAQPDVGEEEAQAAADAIRSGWLTTGRLALEFEQKISEYVQAQHTVAVNSATAGLHLVLIALGIGPGDKVLVPTLTFAATAEVVRAVGAIPVLCDVQDGTLNVSPETLEARYTPDCRAVIVVHFAGEPVEMFSVLDWCRARGLHVIEDAAHAFGAEYRGQKIGSLSSDATVFSFYATKCITTGEGGAICTNSSALAARCRQLRLHGISCDVFDRYTKVGGSWEYDVVEPGWKYNLTDIAAAIGLVQLGKNDAMTSRRLVYASMYEQKKQHWGVRTQEFSESNVNVRHLFPIWGLEDRDGLIRKLADRGIVTSVHFKPLHRMTGYAEGPESFPVAESYWKTCVSLPLSSALSMDEVRYVIESMGESL